MQNANPYTPGAGTSHHVSFAFINYPSSSIAIQYNNDRHAEINAIVNTDRRSYNLFVGRMQLSGIKNSRPCYHCSLNIINNPSIKKIYWTTGNGDEIVYCRPYELLEQPGITISRGYKKIYKSKSRVLNIIEALNN